VKVLDAYGNVVASDGGTVTLAIASGPAAGVLSCANAGFPAVTAVAGVATFFGCQITGTAAAGTYTLVATRTGLTSTGPSSSVVVTAGAATALTFATQPVGNVAEGVAFTTSPVVRVVDAYGNTVTTDTGPITLAISSGPASGVLGCANAGFPTVTTVAGVAAFTGCQITGTAAAGTYTLVATRTGLTAAGPSASVVITVGAAAKLAFTTQPVGNVAVGSTLTTSPVVKAQDAYGNVVTTDTGSVTLAIASGPAGGTLSCTNPGFPTVAAVAGAAAFTSCQIGGAAGTYTLVATRTGLVSSGPSADVVVTAAQTIRIAALTGTAVNQNVNFWKATVTVTVVDQGGAPAAGVVVTGAWSPVTTSPSGCTTAANGQCTIVTPNTAFPASVPTVTWAVSALAKTGSTYTPAANSQNSISLSRP
jgi:hypothetical protein